VELWWFQDERRKKLEYADEYITTFYEIHIITVQNACQFSQHSLACSKEQFTAR
jgi:hypothetical protein